MKAIYKQTHHILKGYNALSAAIGVKKAVILAGGEETRFTPLTNHIPSCTFPVLNRPLIEYTVDFLKMNGIHEIIVAVNKKEGVPCISGNGNKYDIAYHTEDRPRGTAGALKDVSGFIDGEPFLVINSNLFTGNIDLERFIGFHMETGSTATVGIHKNGGNNIDESVSIADDNLIKGFHKIHFSIDKRSRWRPSGIYLFNPSVLRFIDSRNYMDIKEQLIPAMQKEGLDVFACEIEGFHSCLNGINDYINLHRDLLLKRNYRGYLDGKSEIAEGVWAGRNADISPLAYLLGPIIIGDNCRIDSHAQIIGPAVIGNGCRISQGVLVRESILWEDISLSGGSRIEYSIMSEKTDNIPDNFHIKNMIVSNGLRIGDANLIPSDYDIMGVTDLSDTISITGNTRKLYKASKRVMDMALSAAGVVLFLPLFLLLSAAIKSASSGPVFYRQKRCGMNGKLFKMIKFRTMVADAERLHKDLVSSSDTDGPMFKMIKDPRITKLGGLLRKTSLDEIPQLFNVLKGEMSLVGPRPLIMDEMKFSSTWRDTRLKVKPGITGLWQIQGRSEASFHDWIKYDVSYVKNQSLWLDIKILFKTLRVVLKKVGAY